MKIFSSLYQQLLSWAKHQKAPWLLAGVSFAESSFFPIPPDTMLIPMGLAHPQRAWRFACIATISSVLGAILGYFLGSYFIALIMPWLQSPSYIDAYRTASTQFIEYGVWIILIAGFTPVPYKIFTLTAGAMHMPLLPFVIASIIARGARFYLVSALLFFFGERIEPMIARYADQLGWATLLLVLIAISINALL